MWVRLRTFLVGTAEKAAPCLQLLSSHLSVTGAPRNIGVSAAASARMSAGHPD
jgi:hypothetical protein